MKLSGKFSDPFQRHGLLGGLSHLLREGLSRSIKVQLVYRETELVKAGSASGGGKLVVSGDDVDQSQSLDEHCPDWRDRLIRGNHLVCLLSDGEIAGFGWGRFQNELGFSYVDTILPMERPVYYVYDCFTLAEHRGKGVYQAVLKELAANSGESSVYVACRWNNTGSIKGVRKAGFMLDKVIVYFRVFGKAIRFHY
jgi:hypothetical protein